MGAKAVEALRFPYRSIPRPHLHHVVDPAQELGHLGVDPGVVGLCAARPPADHAHQPPHTLVLAHQGPPAVALGTEGDVSLRHGRGAAVHRAHTSNPPPPSAVSES